MTTHPLHVSAVTSRLLGLVAVVCLSFFARGHLPGPTGRRWPRLATLVAAVALLNASFTFDNVWPTPMVRWTGSLSIEVAAGVLALAAIQRWLGPPSRRLLRVLTGVCLLLVVSRYADVTTPALYGREVNLYWDLRFIPDVAALLARGGPLWLVASAIAGALVILGLLYGLLRWAIGRVAVAVSTAPERRVLVGVAVVVSMLFVSQTLSDRVPRAPAFSTPVTALYGRQMWLLTSALTGPASLAASPAMDSDLARVKDADVFLIFLESYGAVTYDNPEFERHLAPSRRAFETAIYETRRHVVSAYVESPTFGGSSWLAHISLMSGLEVKGPATNALLMTQKRDTLVTTFKRHGYRTVALMPGMWQRWPEGAFYGFDEIYGGARLEYHGPEFGWFDMTDQFALARLDALETNRDARRPLFVFFPTISTHTPFTPTPPYQPDWQRVLTDQPYDSAELKRAYAHEPDWLNLAPSYLDAMDYAYATLGGYLRAHAQRDFVMVLLGDHQAPALVSGRGAPWDVPVHVITSREQVLDRLREHGFRQGLEPARPILGPMHTLLPVLLDAFGNRELSAVTDDGTRR